MIRSAGWGLSLVSALPLAIVSFVCFSFVDNTDVVHTAKEGNDFEETVLQDMQSVINTWEGGLQATGGAIVQ